MSANKYYDQISKVLEAIHTTQGEKIQRAGDMMASTIQSGGRVYLFGSGHSVIPVMDMFPRYGAFVGFYPLYDPRLMIANVIGPNGAREALWLERLEGYIEQFLQSYPIGAQDLMMVFSHGGLNAAPIEAAIYAKQRGAKVVTASSHANAQVAIRTHVTGKTLSDFADIAIDNCVAPEDSQVDIGRIEKVAAGSTMAGVFIGMSLVAETGARLAEAGYELKTFASANVEGVTKDHNSRVFDEYARKWYERTPEPVAR